MNGGPPESPPGEIGRNADLDLAGFTSGLGSPPPASAAYTPTVIRLAPGEFHSLVAVCRRHDITLVDTIAGQLADLAAVRHPAPDQRDARERLIEEAAKAQGGTAPYGNWIYFPWDSRVVHTLGREDYFDVITSRNQDKITRQEQERLRTKRIGVVGLSVGAEIAVTIAQEHLCGAIVLADFDRLDLSNLNRVNAGVDELGMNKAHLVARRIAKIDPYLEVVVYDEGISRDNAPEFLDGLDLLVDECDGLEMKYHLREMARKRRLDLLYAADERGLLSVEPYAHAPELPPFHGRIDGPQPPRDEYPNPVVFMRALTEWLGGWDDISERSRRSVERIGHTLCGYPQLASEPRLAAGQIGYVARQLLLGEALDPFFEHLDLAHHITRLNDGTPAADEAPR